MMNRFLIISFILLLAYSACKKASGPANAPSVQPNNNLDSTVSIRATINGKSWQTDSVYGYNVRSSGNDSGIVNLMITGIKKDTSTPTTMVFNITNYTGPNTYAINPPVNAATFYIGNTRHYATTGKIEITSNANFSLIGNFSFTADTLKIEGNFNIANP